MSLFRRISLIILLASSIESVFAQPTADLSLSNYYCVPGQLLNYSYYSQAISDEIHVLMIDREKSLQSYQKVYSDSNVVNGVLKIPDLPDGVYYVLIIDKDLVKVEPIVIGFNSDAFITNESLNLIRKADNSPGLHVSLDSQELRVGDKITGFIKSAKPINYAAIRIVPKAYSDRLRNRQDHQVIGSFEAWSRQVSVKDSVGNILPNLPVGISVYNNAILTDIIFTSSDADGVFSLGDLEEAGKIDIALVSLDKDKKIGAIEFTPFCSNVFDILDMPNFRSSFTQQKIETIQEENLTRQLIYQSYKTDGTDPYEIDVPEMFLPYDYEVDLNEYLTFESMEILIREVLPWVTLKKNKFDEMELKLLSTLYNQRIGRWYYLPEDWEPLCLVNGRIISDPTDLLKIAPSLIHKVQVYLNSINIDNRFFNGILSFTTESNFEESIDISLKSSLPHEQNSDYQTNIEVYPNFQVPVFFNGKTLDSMFTEFSFVHSSEAGEFVAEVNVILADGRKICKYLNFNVMH